MTRTRPSTTTRTPRPWSPAYLERRGTGPDSFAQRLARARLMYARRRELTCSWLALLLLLGCWDIAARLDEGGTQRPVAGVTRSNPAARESSAQPATLRI
jgi:hypothetical protein